MRSAKIFLCHLTSDMFGDILHVCHVFKKISSEGGKRMFSKIRDNFHTYAIITIVFWSTSFISTRIAVQYLSVYSLAFLRNFLATCVLILLVVALKIKPPALRDWKWFFAAGAMGFLLYTVTMGKGSETVTASTCSVVIATSPMLTAFYAQVLYREKLKGYQWLAMVVEFTGIVVLTLMNGVFSRNAGIFWLILATLSSSFYNLFQRKLSKSYAPLPAAAYAIFAGTILMLPFAPQAFQIAPNLPPVAVAHIVILGVFSSALGYYTWSIALAKAPKTSSVTNYMFVQPLAATLCGFLIAGEMPDAATVVGGGIILVGTFFFNFGERFFGRGRT